MLILYRELVEPLAKPTTHVEISKITLHCLFNGNKLIVYCEYYNVDLLQVQYPTVVKASCNLFSFRSDNFTYLTEKLCGRRRDNT